MAQCFIRPALGNPSEMSNTSVFTFDRSILTTPFLPNLLLAICSLCVVDIQHDSLFVNSGTQYHIYVCVPWSSLCFGFRPRLWVSANFGDTLLNRRL